MSLKIAHEFPPNYDEICKHFDICDNKDVVFTYGDILYMPNGKEPSDDLLRHEETHVQQQNDFPGGPKEWWAKYLVDTDFRLSEEIEAYGVQYKYVYENKSRDQRRKAIKFFAKCLSGAMYGNALSNKQATDVIVEKAESLNA